MIRRNSAIERERNRECMTRRELGFCVIYNENILIDLFVLFEMFLNGCIVSGNEIGKYKDLSLGSTHAWKGSISLIFRCWTPRAGPLASGVLAPHLVYAHLFSPLFFFVSSGRIIIYVSVVDRTLEGSLWPLNIDCLTVVLVNKHAFFPLP
ncbi:hypothetical protein V1525DRAFT_138174 [Lipomyces kononenkoae]|uniref:Uncharacterized protein n=1 Tax=Lipomyces kononenkoae TaxID=34357 RepID=A0ACC3T217_LIPKO